MCTWASMRPGATHMPVCVDRLAAVVAGADAGDPAVGDRDVGREPLAGEHRQDAAARDDDVGGLVPAGHGEPSRQIGHSPALRSYTRSSRPLPG